MAKHRDEEKEEKGVRPTLDAVLKDLAKDGCPV